MLFLPVSFNKVNVLVMCKICSRFLEMQRTDNEIKYGTIAEYRKHKQV